MSANIKQRPFPFPDLEMSMVCRVVGGTDLNAGALVRLITGTNKGTAELDGVAVGDWFGERVVASGLDGYPATRDISIDAADDSLSPPFLGILLEATANDSTGLVVFRGLVRNKSVTVVDATEYPQGAAVFIDVSTNGATADGHDLVLASGTVLPASGDIVVGRLADGFLSSGTSDLVDIFFDGVFAPATA